MITNPDPQLTFGAQNLIGTDDELVERGWRFEALGDDTDWGNPVPIIEKIDTWLEQGAIEALKGYDNREMNVRVLIVGEDSDALAAGELALMLETGKPNLLTWTPPDGRGEACVFSVVMSSIEFAFDHTEEIRDEPTRMWALKIHAEPFVRAVDAVTATRPAPVVSDDIVVTSIDDCTSTTGWTGSPNTPTTSGGAVRETRALASFVAAGTMSLKRSGLSTDMAAAPFLRLEFAYPYGPQTTAVKINNAGASPVAVAGNVGWYQFAGILTDVEIIITDTTKTSIAHSVQLYVADISMSNAPADPGATGRQVGGTLTVAGSAPTQGNLAIFDESDALGDVLIYTCPANPALVTPDLRQFLQAGPTPTPDASTVSGSTSVLTDNHLFAVPVAGLASAGHLFMARLKHASTGTYSINWVAIAEQGGVYLDEYPAGAVDIHLTAGVWTIVVIESVDLPPRKMGNLGHVIMGLGSSDAVVIDEAWLFNIEGGNLTQVAAGSGTPAAGGPSNRVWLDAPYVDVPNPAVYLGTEEDRSDSFHAGPEMDSIAVHRFVPPLMFVHSVTTKSVASVIELNHHPRFHTHVARPSA